MHMSPALVGWAVHWYPDQARVPTQSWSAAQQEAWFTGTFFQLVILPMGPYMLWSITYYLKIFVISREKVQQEYALFLAGFLTAGLTTLIGLVMTYVLRGDASPIARSHYRFLSRTFWLGVVWALMIGFFVLVASCCASPSSA